MSSIREFKIFQIIDLFLHTQPAGDVCVVKTISFTFSFYR